MADLFTIYNKGLYKEGTSVYTSDLPVNSISVDGIAGIQSISGYVNDNTEITQGTLQSGNFKKGVQGWQIQANGDVEFNNGTFRGQVEIGTTGGAEVVIAGNNINLYDDSTGGGGVITGDTATVNFYRADGLTGNFQIQKRHHKDNNEGNVMEMFYNAAPLSGSNLLYIGREGDYSSHLDSPGYTNEILLSSIDGVAIETTNLHNFSDRYPFIIAYSDTISAQGIACGLFGEGKDGFSSLGFLTERLTFTGATSFEVGDTITGNSTGATAKLTRKYNSTGSIFYANHTSKGVDFSVSDNACTTDGAGGGSGTASISANDFLYLRSLAVLDDLNVRLNGYLIPNNDNTYDIGSESNRIKDLHIAGTIYGGGGSLTYPLGESFTGASAPQAAVLINDLYQYRISQYVSNRETWFGYRSVDIDDVYKRAIRIIPRTTVSIDSLNVYIGKVGTPVDNVSISIQTDSGDLPSGTAISNGTTSIAGSSLSTTATLTNITFSTPPTLTAGTTYWVVFERDGTKKNENYYFLCGTNMQSVGATPDVTKCYYASFVSVVYNNYYSDWFGTDTWNTVPYLELITDTGEQIFSLWKSDANANTDIMCCAMGIVTTTGSAGGDGTFYKAGGTVQTTGLLAGADYYVSNTAGEISTSGTGQYIGRASSSTALNIPNNLIGPIQYIYAASNAIAQKMLFDGTLYGHSNNADTVTGTIANDSALSIDVVTYSGVGSTGVSIPIRKGQWYLLRDNDWDYIAFIPNFS